MELELRCVYPTASLQLRQEQWSALGRKWTPHLGLTQLCFIFGLNLLCILCMTNVVLLSEHCLCVQEPEVYYPEVANWKWVFKECFSQYKYMINKGIAVSHLKKSVLLSYPPLPDNDLIWEGRFIHLNQC